MSNELLVITKELTNQPASTNPVSVTVNTSSNLWVANWPTNQPYPTNIWVANMPTNFGAFTNSPFTLTNYATESTLAGISNLLASLLNGGTSSNDINAEAAFTAAYFPAWIRRRPMPPTAPMAATAQPGSSKSPTVPDTPLT